MIQNDNNDNRDAGTTQIPGGFNLVTNQNNTNYTENNNNNLTDNTDNNRPNIHNDDNMINNNNNTTGNKNNNINDANQNITFHLNNAIDINPNNTNHTTDNNFNVNVNHTTDNNFNVNVNHATDNNFNVNVNHATENNFNVNINHTTENNFNVNINHTTNNNNTQNTQQNDSNDDSIPYVPHPRQTVVNDKDFQGSAPDSQNDNDNDNTNNQNGGKRDRTKEIPDDEKWKCPICYDSLNQPVVTQCGHAFCWPCINEWLKRSNVCPVCHGTIDLKHLIPIYGQGEEANLDSPPPPKPEYQNIHTFTYPNVHQTFANAVNNFMNHQTDFYLQILAILFLILSLFFY